MATELPAGTSCPLCDGEGVEAFLGRDQLMGLPGEFTYRECASCGALYQAPLPDTQTIASFYPDSYLDHNRPPVTKPFGWLRRGVLASRYGYTALVNNGFQRVVGWLAGVVFYRDEISFDQGGPALDVGCGNGKFVRKLAALGWQARGVEFSESAAKAGISAGLDISIGTLEEAAFAAESFNLISARHLLEHLPDPKRFMAEIHRLLRPGGRLLIRTPNSNALGRRWFGANWYHCDPPRHLILFSPGNLRGIASQAGLREVVCKTFASPKIVLNSWDYYRENKGSPSRKQSIKRLLARVYVGLAAISGRGDEIFAVYEKK